MGFSAGRFREDPYNVHNMVGQEAAVQVLLQQGAGPMAVSSAEEARAHGSQPHHFGQQEAQAWVVNSVAIDHDGDMLLQAALFHAAQESQEEPARRA